MNSYLWFGFGLVINLALCQALSPRLRSPGRNNIQTKQHRDINCLDAFEECSKSSKCSAALKRLDKKCKVISGRCGAEMADLPRCGLIMDNIFSFGFPRKCICSKDSTECNSIVEKVYSNPCFASIRHLRKNNLFPKDVTAYDKVSGREPTTAPVEWSKLANENELVSKSERKFALFEEVFGDKGTKKPLGRKSNHVVVDKDENIQRLSKEVAVAHRKPQKEPFEPTSEGEQTAQLQVDADRFKQRLDRAEESEKATVEMDEQSSHQHHSQEEDSPVGKVTKDNTDYKSIAFILGALLGLFVLTTTTFFLWTRVKLSFFYAQGKIVRDQREDEEIRSKSQSSIKNNRYSGHVDAGV